MQTGAEPGDDIARALAAVGVGPGARVATIDAADDAYWAHLGRVRVIAEVPWDGVDTFWAAGDAGRRGVYHAFRTAGPPPSSRTIRRRGRTRASGPR